MAKPLSARVLEEIDSRRRLDLVLPLLLESADDFVRVTSLRRVLGMCGIAPTVTYLTEALAKVGTYVEQSRIDNGRKNVLPGKRLREHGLHKARRALQVDWERRLLGEGLTPEPAQVPYWHRVSGDQAHSMLAGKGGSDGKPFEGFFRAHTSVILPSDSERVGPHGANPSAMERVFMVASARTAAGHYNHTMEEWVWRGAKWDEYPELHRTALELHVVEGIDAKEIAERLGETRGTIKMILQRHRALAGIVPRGKQVKR